MASASSRGMGAPGSAASSESSAVPGSLSQGTLTTGWGAPIGDNRHSLIAGERGYVAVDPVMWEKNAHLNRERIPERVVHAEGTGAFGYFECSDSAASELCKAKVFGKAGKQTKVLIRFSGVVGERGHSTTDREPRGFAIKFYTEEGNWDLVCNNFPVFFIKDSILFPDLIHAVKRNPSTNLKDANAFWDFMSAYPESAHAILMTFGDRAIPYSYRNMNGYGNHTFRFVNEAGKAHWVKLHVRSEEGVKNMTAEAAETMRGHDPDYLHRDLSAFIDSGGSSVWKLQCQVIPEADVAGLPYDIFDVTKVVPHSDYPLRTLGRIVLNQNPSNFFEDIEQAAFAPGNLVPGIEAGPDPVLQGRLLAYTDTQRYRLGVNFMQLKSNAPRCPVANHMRDGLMARDLPGAVANYYTGIPATGEPQSTTPRALERDAYLPSAAVGLSRHAPVTTSSQRLDDFAQPRVLYQRVMTPEERGRLSSNVAGHLRNARPEVQSRALERLFSRVDPSLAEDISRKIKGAEEGSFFPTSSLSISGKPKKLFASQEKEGNSIVFLSDYDKRGADQPGTEEYNRTASAGSASSAASEGKYAAGGGISSAELPGVGQPLQERHLAAASAAAGVSKAQHPMMASAPASSGTVGSMLKTAASQAASAVTNVLLPGDRR